MFAFKFKDKHPSVFALVIGIVITAVLFSFVFYIVYTIIYEGMHLEKLLEGEPEYDVVPIAPPSEDIKLVHR